MSVAPQDRKDLLKVAAFIGVGILVIALLKMMLGY